MHLDQAYMQRALFLASQGAGFVLPNPLVGAVIVKDGKLLGEGHHQAFGSAHAEINAIAAVKNKADLKGATLYVNLEPCAHYGKTPPCALALIQCGIARVVVANLDPNPLVAGKGMALLEEAGITTEIGVLAAEGAELNRAFFYFHTHGKPYVCLKYAQSKDGFVAKVNGQPHRFSNAQSQVLVHRLRASHQGILVGLNTVLCDDPALTVRDWHGRSPLRIVLDPLGHLDQQNYRLLQDGLETWILSQEKQGQRGNVTWFALGAEFSSARILDFLGSKGMVSVLVEGGPKTLALFMQGNHYQEIIRIESNEVLGAGISAPVWEGTGLVFSLGNNNTWTWARN